LLFRTVLRSTPRNKSAHPAHVGRADDDLERQKAASFETGKDDARRGLPVIGTNILLLGAFRRSPKPSLFRYSLSIYFIM
jgi:hypothetical protein